MESTRVTPIIPSRSRGIPCRPLWSKKSVRWMEPGPGRKEPKGSRRAGRARLLAGLPGREGIRWQGSRRTRSGRSRARGTQGLVRRIVPTFCNGRSGSRGGLGRVQEECGLPADVTLRSAAVGGGARRHASVFRSPGKRDRAVRARRAWSLVLRLHSSVSGWKRPHGSIPHERDTGFGRLSVDGHPPKGPQELSRRVGSACFRVFSVLQKPLQWSTCGIARNRASRLSMESPCSVSTARGSRCVKPPLLIWPTYNQESDARRCRTARTPRPEPIAGLPRSEVIPPRSEPAHC
jgi:hypothetical protein